MAHGPEEVFGGDWAELLVALLHTYRKPSSFLWAHSAITTSNERTQHHYQQWL
jgi:hypothetical protein